MKNQYFFAGFVTLHSRGHRFQLQFQRDKIPRRHKQRNVRGSVPIFRLDDVGLRRTLGGRLKTDPQLTA
jgi:hypothetical protein